MTEEVPRYQGDDTNASNIYYLANQPKKLNAWAKVAKNSQYEFDNIFLLSVMTNLRREQIWQKLWQFFIFRQFGIDPFSQGTQTAKTIRSREKRMEVNILKTKSLREFQFELKFVELNQKRWIF